MRGNRVLCLLSCLFACSAPEIAWAGEYWVSPTGAAAWTACESATPLDGAAACSLATANGSLVGGDTAYLRGGEYNTHIFPANSGTGPSQRITYQAASGEVPVVVNNATTYATYYHGIALIGRSYIRVSGITVDRPPEMQRPLMITHGGSYNEIDHCIVDGHGGGAIMIWDGGSTPHPSGEPCVHNWLHHNTFANTGSLSWTGAYVNDDGGFQLGVPGYDNESNQTTIEENVFYCGGHHNLETFTKRNVIRDNVFHHEGCMPNETGHDATYGPDTNSLWGNRNIQIYDGYGEDKWNLIEGNRFGHAGPPPDDDGGDGFTLTAPRNIVRYNAIFNSLNNGILMKTGAQSLADNNRVYHNTVYQSGRYQNPGPQWQGAAFRWYGSYARVGNVVKHNVLFEYGGTTEILGGSATITTDNVVVDNWLTADGDPLFVNGDLSDPTSLTLPDLHLGVGSGAIDAAAHLTVAVGAGVASTMLVLEDALYFQDGSWGSSLAGHQADWIAVGSVDHVLEVSVIDYAANTITLASAASWEDGAPVWLYRKSDGARVLHGTAPDFGAYEFDPDGPGGGGAGGGTGAAGGVGAAGGAGAMGGAGAVGGAGASGGAGATGLAAAPAAGEEGDCGCRFRSRRSIGPSAWLAMAAAAGLVRRRRPRALA